MDEELDYLWETLGLEITADLWPERDKIHPTLRPAITVMQAKYRRASFLIMRMSWHAGSAPPQATQRQRLRPVAGGHRGQDPGKSGRIPAG